MEAGEVVATLISNDRHLGQLVGVARDEVQEAELVEALGSLVGTFDDLVVALLESGRGETIPDLVDVQRLGGLQSNVEVAALDGKVEASALVLDEMQGNFGVALLLQESDDGLTDEVAVLDDGQDVVVLALYQRQLEAELGRVDGDVLRTSRSVETGDGFALDSGKIDGLLERLDDAVVALRERILDVVERAVEQDTTLVPSSTLDADRFVDEVARRE